MAMSREKRVLLVAEDQLAFGRFLANITAARDDLKGTHPESLLLELVELKIRRMEDARLGPNPLTRVK